MNIKIYSLINYIKGNWLLQENFYLFNGKKSHVYRTNVSLFDEYLDLDINIDQFILKCNAYELYQDKAYSIFLKYNKVQLLELSDKLKYYSLTEKKYNKLLSINYRYNLNYMSMDENLYIINENIMLSMTWLKSIKSNRYLGIKISSYLRRVNKI